MTATDCSTCNYRMCRNTWIVMCWCCIVRWSS